MDRPGATSKGNHPDLLTAALFIGFGALGLWSTWDLEAGSAAQMGASYLPRVVCGLLIGVGLVVGLRGLRHPALRLEPAQVRPLAVILLSIVAFAFAATHLGFVVASLILIGGSALAERGGLRWQTLWLALGLTAFGALVFIYGLGVQIRLWPI
jgi:putative tricarboxylic transport membrane protein